MVFTGSYSWPPEIELRLCRHAVATMPVTELIVFGKHVNYTSHAVVMNGM